MKRALGKRRVSLLPNMIMILKLNQLQSILKSATEMTWFLTTVVNVTGGTYLQRAGKRQVKSVSSVLQAMVVIRIHIKQRQMLEQGLIFSMTSKE